MGTVRNNISGYDLSAIKLLSYINEDNNKRTVSWYVDQLAEYKLGKWNTIVDLGVDSIEEVIQPDLIREERYVVLNPTNNGNSRLHLKPVLVSGSFLAQIYEDVSGTWQATSECRVSDGLNYVSISSQESFEYNDLSIYKNGVLQNKGTDVTFIEEDVIQFTYSLDADDIITIRKQVGL